jgi:hypothetical protein
LIFIIENSLKLKKIIGKWGHAFDIVEKAINDQQEILNLE